MSQIESFPMLIVFKKVIASIDDVFEEDQSQVFKGFLGNAFPVTGCSLCWN